MLLYSEIGNYGTYNMLIFSPSFFISSTMQIIPKFKEYAKEHGESGKSPVIIATCSAKQKMCTYYMVRIVDVLRQYLLLSRNVKANFRSMFT